MLKLRLDLDSMSEESYFYTEFDIGKEGHTITIDGKNKEKFLDEYAKVWRDEQKKIWKL